MAVISTLRFLSVTDPRPYPDLEPEDVINVDQADILVLDQGMSSGLPSVAIKADLPNGEVVVIQTSARLFCTHARAIMARYPSLFEGKE